MFLGEAGRSFTETPEERKRNEQDGKHVSCPLSNEVKPMKQRGAFVLIELRMVIAIIATCTTACIGGNGLFLRESFSPILDAQRNDAGTDGWDSIKDGHTLQP